MVGWWRWHGRVRNEDPRRGKLLLDPYARSTLWPPKCVWVWESTLDLFFACVRPHSVAVAEDRRSRRRRSDFFRSAKVIKEALLCLNQTRTMFQDEDIVRLIFYFDVISPHLTLRASWLVPRNHTTIPTAPKSTQ